MQNLEAHGIPSDILEYELDYDDFLELRRTKMAGLIKNYFEKLISN